MIHRETNPDIINTIVNDPAVRPFVDFSGQTAPLDFAPTIGTPGMLYLRDDSDGLAAFELTAPGVYEAHLLFGPGTRGGRALDTMHDMLAWLFERGASVVWGAIDRTHRRAVLIGRMIGATATGDDETAIFEVRRAR